MLDQKEKKRFCGYCGMEYYMDMSDWQDHLDACEENMSKWISKTRKPEEPKG